MLTYSRADSECGDGRNYINNLWKILALLTHVLFLPRDMNLVCRTAWKPNSEVSRNTH